MGCAPAAARAQLRAEPVFRASFPNSDGLGNDAPSVPARMAVRAHGRSSFGPAWSVLRRWSRTDCRGRGSTGWSRFYGDVGDGSAVPVLRLLDHERVSAQASTAKQRRRCRCAAGLKSPRALPCGMAAQGEDLAGGDQEDFGDGVEVSEDRAQVGDRLTRGAGHPVGAAAGPGVQVGRSWSRSTTSSPASASRRMSRYSEPSGVVSGPRPAFPAVCSRRAVRSKARPTLPRSTGCGPCVAPCGRGWCARRAGRAVWWRGAGAVRRRRGCGPRGAG